VRGCNAIIETAKQQARPCPSPRTSRRDPINRLARALIDDGAIGRRV